MPNNWQATARRRDQVARQYLGLLSRKQADYLASAPHEAPVLVMDLDAVARQYRTLSDGLAGVAIHYAVKANPAPEIIARLVGLGASFDAASRAEIELCLAQGAGVKQISFGNTIKRAADIAWAWAQGIELFAADAREELAKIAAQAPGAKVYLRLLVETCEADWPLSRKFGAPAEEIPALLQEAVRLGLTPVGLSFHVGSQTRQAAMWQPILAQAAAVWREARQLGFELSLLNLGGGFPASYDRGVQDSETYCREVMAQVQALFGPVPQLMAEPGRGLVAGAGVIRAEVLLVSRKRASDLARWVYLDIGKFSGLAETADEAIRYPVLAAVEGGERGPCILAGPTCDSLDVLYEKRPLQLPMSLKAGDPLLILASGAYTASYASVGFNGFPPLKVVCL